MTFIRHNFGAHTVTINVAVARFTESARTASTGRKSRRRARLRRLLRGETP